MVEITILSQATKKRIKRRLRGVEIGQVEQLSSMSALYGENGVFIMVVSNHPAEAIASHHSFLIFLAGGALILCVL